MFPVSLSFWGDAGCPTMNERTCEQAGALPGSTPGTCISNFGGDEIPLWIVIVPTGEIFYQPHSFCNTCNDNFRANTDNGVFISFLQQSVESGIGAHPGYDRWGNTHTIIRSYNRICNGGEYYLLGSSAYLLNPHPYYSAYENLPDMLSPTGNVVESHWDQGYLLELSCVGPSAPNWWQFSSEENPIFPTANCNWAELYDCCGGVYVPQAVDYTCGSSWRRCDGTIMGPFGVATVRDNRSMRVYPYTRETVPCCTHGPYCTGGNSLIANTDPETKGACCITATFFGVHRSSNAPCYYGHMDVDPTLTHDVVVHYRNTGHLAWYSEPYGCMDPFPSLLTISGVAYGPDESGCYGSRYTVVISGSSVVMTDYGLAQVWVVFKKVVDLPGYADLVSPYGGPFVWKLTPDEFDSLFTAIPFDPDLSGNYGLGYSTNFDNSTVSLSLAEKDYNECANIPHDNPFVFVEYWELRFTPVTQRVLYYDENYWEVDGSSGCRLGPKQKRQIIPIVPGASWVMNDSMNFPVTFQFEGESHARGSIWMGKPPDDEDSVTIADGQSGHSPVTFEFDEGLGSTGTIELTGLPSDGDTITLNDGGHDPATLEFDDGIAATGTVTLAANSTDNDAVIIHDGVNASIFFEFDNNSSVDAKATAVTIGATKEITIANLIAAINAAADFDITATPSSPPDNVCNLENDKAGPKGNRQITHYGGDITTDGMSGGEDGGDDVAEGNVGVPIGWTIEETMANLIFAINAGTSLDITATASSPPDAACSLENSHKCEASNQPILRSGANITVSGMSGGEDGGDDCTGTEDVCVATGWGVAESMSNLADAINAAGGLDVTATLVTDGSCRLKNIRVGPDGNVEITETGESMTVEGMAGGATGDALPDCVQGIKIVEDDETLLDDIRDKINMLFGSDIGCPESEPNTEFYMRAWDNEPETLALLMLLLLSNDSQSEWIPDPISDDELLITNIVDLSYCGNGGEADIMNAGILKIGRTWHNPDREFTYNGTTIKVDDETTFPLSDGTTSKTFEFDNNGLILAGNIRVEIGLTSKATMENIIAAINASGLEIEAVPSDPPDENCTLWQGEGDDRRQVGSMSFSSDWYEIDPENPEGVVVTLDQRGIIGEYWFQNSFPVAVWVWQDQRRLDGYFVQLLFDLCYMGGMHYSFCYPGWGNEPSKFACKVDDEWQRCGYKDGTEWSLTPYLIDRTP